MAFRAVSTASRPPHLPLLPPPSSSTLTSAPKPSSLPKSTQTKLQVKPISVSLPLSTAISLFTLSTSPNEANAFTLSKDQIMSSLTQVEEKVGQAQEVGSSVLGVTQTVIKGVVDTLKPAVDAAMPILQKAGDQALKTASPVFSEASKKAQEAFQSSGIDTEPVLTAAKTATDVAQQSSKVIDAAKPIASSTFETISADPILIVDAAGVAILAYLLLPPILSAISFNFRGFKGKLTPAQTLDMLCTQDHLLIDIRSEKDKDKAGVPRLPSSAKNKMISIPLEELPSKIKNIVRNTKKVEAEIAALKISYLKKLGKGSNIVIMDSYSDTAKIVAKTLTNLGFKNCWIMADGFSGGRGWLQSRLGTDSYNVSFAQVLSPSRIVPAVRRSLIGLTIQELCIGKRSCRDNGLNKVINLRGLGACGNFFLHDKALVSWIAKLYDLECLKLRHNLAIIEDRSITAIPKLMPFTNHKNLYKRHLKGLLQKLLEPDEFPPNELSSQDLLLLQDPMTALEKLPSLRILT